MGVSSTLRLPSLSAQAVPNLFNHLQISSNAKVVARWSITIRSFRASWPQEGSKPRLMWQVWLSDYPGLVFVLIEDPGSITRAKAWKDWVTNKGKPTSTDQMQVDGTTASEDQPATIEDVTIVEPLQAKPELEVPSHTRYTLSVLSSSLPAMLGKLNLPAPHGAAQGTPGPGAWIPRGSPVSIDGLLLSLSSTPSDQPDWHVRVGSVVAGGGRSAGAVIDAEFLPISTLQPSSPFMHNFLASLFPQHLVESPSTAAVSAQMWEEVVPRSNAEWHTMITQRSKKRVTKDKKQPKPFEWVEEHESVAGSSESEGEEMQDSDDEDLPLGAVLQQNGKEDKSIKLPFRGLERDAEQPDDAWTGVERGRRVAFSYIQMLRAEGII